MRLIALRKSCSLCCRAVCLVLLSLALVGASSGRAVAQSVTFSRDKPSVSFGDLNLCLPGVTPMGPCSKTLSLTYNITQGGTLGTPKVVTQGIPNLDFTMGSGSTCAGTVTAPGTCTVEAVFAPTQAGYRSGAVQIISGDGKVLATTFLFGNSLGAQIGFNPAQEIQHIVPVKHVEPNPAYFDAVMAVDAQDDIFVALGGVEVVELKADGSAPVVVGSLDMDAAEAIAIDGAGNVFVDGYAGGSEVVEVVELPAGGGPRVMITDQGSQANNSIAVDGAGNLYVTQDDPITVRVFHPGSTAVTTISLPSYSFELGVTGPGDVYSLQEVPSNNILHEIVKIPADGGPNLIFSDPLAGGDDDLYSFAVDGVGNVVGVEQRGPVFALGPGNIPPQDLTSFGLEYLVANDAVGNPFVTGSYYLSDQITEIDRGKAVPLNFGVVYAGKTVTLPLTISNTGNQTLVVDASFDNASYSITGMSPNNCLAGVAPSRTCVLQVSFAPTATGVQKAHLHLQTNAINSPDVLLEATAEEPAPVFSPASGVFSSSQMVSITSTQTGAAIYFTTDGTLPTTGSTRYTGPISVSKTERITAIGVIVGQHDSFGTATYTITPAGANDTINFSEGFANSGSKLQFNGSGQLDGDRLELTDGKNGEVTSVYYTGLMNLAAFNTYFTFELTDQLADGFTFIIQNTGLNAIGGAGQELGSGNNFRSAAVKFDLFNNAGEGLNSTGLYLNGLFPTTPSIDLKGTGIDLHAHDPILAQLAYDGTNLVLTLTDTVTFLSWSHSFAVDLPKVVGSTGYVGFTASTGGKSAIQEISSWTFVDGAPGAAPPLLAGSPGPSFGSGFGSSSVTLNGSALLAGSALQLTSGKTAETGSAFYPKPVNVQAFTTDFSFQVTNPEADGFTFTIQNKGAGVLGGAGQGLGYQGIGQSVAVKFDLHSNAGEGQDSAGVYTDGAVPTIPSVDLTGSGIDLHSSDILAAHVTYDGNNLVVTLTDAVTHATWTHSFPVYIPATVGSNTAYVGFTGSTGTKTAVQQILNWTFTNP